MASAGYIDIHTHKKAIAEHISICSLHSDFTRARSGILCSIGLHPWYISAQALGSEFEQLQQFSALYNVMAIGECGLDKVCETDWDMQVRAFKMQIELANNVNKPLIIHCVRAYEEVLKILKDAKVSVPVIFHGFNKKWQLAEQILKQEYYLSFGITQIEEVLINIPADKYFLETDSSGSDIKDIYQSVATIRKTSLDTLILQLQKNFETVFKR
jgi:TatD DNase family protein